MQRSSRNADEKVIVMYDDFETKTSYKYLKEVIENINEPICLLGGWAIYFHVNDAFQKRQGRPYLGSRDIDLGFNMQTTLGKTLDILIKKLKFRA